MYSAASVYSSMASRYAPVVAKYASFLNSVFSFPTLFLAESSSSCAHFMSPLWQAYMAALLSFSMLRDIMITSSLIWSNSFI